MTPTLSFEQYLDTVITMYGDAVLDSNCTLHVASYEATVQFTHSSILLEVSTVNQVTVKNGDLSIVVSAAKSKSAPQLRPLTVVQDESSLLGEK